MEFHGTTILAVRHGGKVVVAGDGQVTLGSTVRVDVALQLSAVEEEIVVTGGDPFMNRANMAATIDGLMSKAREDKGSTSIPKPLQEKLIALRKKYPHNTTKRLLKILIYSGAWNGKSPSPASFYRFVAQKNLKRNPSSPPDWRSLRSSPVSSSPCTEPPPDDVSVPSVSRRPCGPGRVRQDGLGS